MFSNFNYIRPGKNLKKQVKRVLEYISHRKGKDNKKMDRILFGHGGPLTEEQVSRMIYEAPKNTYYWRLKLSPDPNGENKEKNLDLWQLTKKVVEYLEKKLQREIPFIGAEHNDHTEIPHVHAVLLIQRIGREMLITQETIDEVRDLATRLALEQKLDRQQTLDLIPQQQEQQQQATIGMAGGKAKHAVPKPNLTQAKPRVSVAECPDCHTSQPVEVLSQKFMKCVGCDRVFSRDQSVGRGAEHEQLSL